MLTSADQSALLLSLQLASVATLIMLLLGAPLAWWLSRTASKWKALINTIVALPIVLPPTVLGFYLLIVLGPHGWVGELVRDLGLEPFPFSFKGLVLASVLYSLPFVVQPLQTAFSAIDQRWLDTAATLRASPFDTFINVVLPLAKPGFLSATVLGFAHTVGEFGVVLMIGGNIPDKTRVVSVQIYNHVEALEYSEAHALAAILLGFSFGVLLLLYNNPKAAVLGGLND